MSSHSAGFWLPETDMIYCDLVGSELSTFYSHEIPSKSQPPLNFIKPPFFLGYPREIPCFPGKKIPTPSANITCCQAGSLVVPWRAVEILWRNEKKCWVNLDVVGICGMHRCTKAQMHRCTGAYIDRYIDT